MNEWDAWIYINGREPALLRKVREMLRIADAVPPPSDTEAFSQRVMASIASSRSGRVPAEEGRDDLDDHDLDDRDDLDDDDDLHDEEAGDNEGEDEVAGQEKEEEAPGVMRAEEAVPSPVPGLPAAVAALMSLDATGATGGHGVVGLPKTSLSLDVAGAMRDRRPAPVVVVEDAPALDPHTLRVVAIGGGGDGGAGGGVGGAGGEAGGGGGGVRADFVKTMMHDADRIAKAVAAHREQAAGAGAAVGAGAGAAVGTGVEKEVGEGGLTLESYASLVAELRVGREKGYLLRRYRVDGDGVFERVVGYWEGRMAREPEVRRAYEGLVERFVGYLRVLSGGG